MPDKDKETKEKLNRTVEGEVVDGRLDEPKITELTNTIPKQKDKTAIIITLSVVVFIATCFAVGDIYIHLHNNARLSGATIYTQQEYTSPHMGRRGGYIVTTASSSTTDSATTSTTTMVSGVVISVDTNSFVIGGNGSKTTIKTSDNTAWNTTGKKASVGDSVLVTGTESDNVIVAADIRIINQ